MWQISEIVLKQPPDGANGDEFQSALRLPSEFFNDTFTVTFLSQTFGITGQDGAILRVSVEYDMTDAVEVLGGVVFYQSGDLPHFQNTGDNDRLFLKLNTAFNLPFAPPNSSNSLPAVVSQSMI